MELASDELDSPHTPAVSSFVLAPTPSRCTAWSTDASSLDFFSPAALPSSGNSSRPCSSVKPPVFSPPHASKGSGFWTFEDSGKNVVLKARASSFSFSSPLLAHPLCHLDLLAGGCREREKEEHIFAAASACPACAVSVARLQAGDRAVVEGPPHSGKTFLLKQMAAEIALGCCPQFFLPDCGSRRKGQGVLVLAYGGDLSLHDIRETIEDMLTANFQASRLCCRAEHAGSWPSPLSSFASAGEKSRMRHIVSCMAEQALRHVFVINVYTPLQLLHIAKWLPFFFCAHPSVRALLVDGVIKNVASAMAESPAGPGRTFFSFSSRGRGVDAMRTEGRKRRRTEAHYEGQGLAQDSSQSNHSTSPFFSSTCYPSLDASRNSPPATGGLCPFRGPTHSMHLLTLAVQQILRLHQEERLLLVYTKQFSASIEGKNKGEDSVSLPLSVPRFAAKQEPLERPTAQRHGEGNLDCPYTSDSALLGFHKGVKACVAEGGLLSGKTAVGAHSSCSDETVSGSRSSKSFHELQKRARTHMSTDAFVARNGSTEARSGNPVEGIPGNEEMWQNVKFLCFPKCSVGALLRNVATAATSERRSPVLRCPHCRSRAASQLSRSTGTVWANIPRRHYRVFQFQFVRAESSVTCDPIPIKGTRRPTEKRVFTEKKNSLHSPGTFLACLCSWRSADDFGRYPVSLKKAVSGPDMVAQSGGSCSRQITGVVVGGRHVVREGRVSDWDRQERSSGDLRGNQQNDRTSEAREQEEQEKGKEHCFSRDPLLAVVQGKGEQTRETRAATTVPEKPRCAACGVFFFLTKDGQRDFVLPV
ncbi:hypothetical protein TGVAND_308850 [Toxoplasma gondii VAND]|uniref:Uncharacterized protein n=1 Tax=Toxoplasma gondii VAND TaxID=933077 RepID=A0A086QBT7_TOXGO|nr:hypothetical protein TGVAND_308850 [Toxoplasma gondii VAND]